jgi:hypothetical protein
VKWYLRSGSRRGPLNQEAFKLFGWAPPLSGFQSGKCSGAECCLVENHDDLESLLGAAKTMNPKRFGVSSSIRPWFDDPHPESSR